MPPLTCPFRYAGGKRHIAGDVWAKFGNPEFYAEPFAGTIAVLLARPGGPGVNEIVGDTRGAIVNFWRAVQADPDAVARHADHPLFDADYIARAKWFLAWEADALDCITADMEWYCPKAAGLWAWLSSVDIRGGVARGDVRAGLGWPPGGVMIRSNPHGSITAWMRALQARVKDVLVLCRSWTSTVTPARLCYSDDVGVLLDPPYKLHKTAADNRDFYSTGKVDNSIAEESYAWAVEHGNKYRVAYCCHEGDFPVPEGWTTKESTLMALYRSDRMYDVRDQVMFSPTCVSQQGLFDL